MRSRSGRITVLFFVLGTLSLVPAVSGQQATFTTTPPTIDGVVGATEWAGAGSISGTVGSVYFLHDGTNLYMLIDMTSDTVNDFEVFLLTFDIDRNGSGTLGVDSLYGMCPDVLGRTTWLSDCGWTGCGPTDGAYAEGFGTSPASATSHSIFELRIPLSELQAQTSDALLLHLTLWTGSSWEYLPPAIEECDWPNYLPLTLASPRAIPVMSGLGMVAVIALLAGTGLVFLRRIWG